VAELIEEKAADDRANDPENEIKNEAAASAVDDLAGDETGNQAKNNPGENRHSSPPKHWRRVPKLTPVTIKSVNQLFVPALTN
jgi:membrane protein involved in colicin uptake